MTNEYEEIMKPILFTPNVVQGDPSLRYKLFSRGNGMYSLTPRGKAFRATSERDDCGLGCRCGVFLRPLGKRGQEMLKKAKTFEGRPYMTPRPFPEVTVAMRPARHWKPTERFKRWLKSKPKGAIVGKSCKSMSCPIYRYLTFKGHDVVAVSVHTVKLSIKNGLYTMNLPYWTVRFISLMDANNPVGKSITANQALHILERVETELYL